MHFARLEYFTWEVPKSEKLAQVTQVRWLRYGCSEKLILHTI